MGWYTKFTKTASEIDNFCNHISNERLEETIYFSSNRKHETSYYVNIVFRQVENLNRNKIKSTNDPYWIVAINAFSYESGNVVYKRIMYHKQKSDAKSNYEKVIKTLTDLRQAQEANNIPTATLSSMIWHALQDIQGDKNIKPVGSGNIIYLRQDHNINENKGNLFKNILYLDKANRQLVEEDFHGYEDMKNYF